MSGSGDAVHAMTLRDYLQVVRRRKWVIALAVVLVPAAAVAFSLHQQKLYSASAKVLISSQDLSGQLTGVQATPLPLGAQSALAQTPAVAQRAVNALGRAGVTASELLAESSVSIDTTTGIMSMAVTGRDPVEAQRLVNAYARAFTVYRRHLDTAAIRNALTGVDKHLAALASAGDTTSALYASLQTQQQTLQTMSALEMSNASVLRSAEGASLTQPKTKRNGVLGLVLGIVLGLGLAFLWEALDTRVRSAEEIAERLGGLPLLARVPEPDKQLRAERRLAMLDNPSGTQAETFRMLRTNLDFATLGRDVRTIMITSAVEQEGKSTTIANLAVALARTGKRVALIDLDLRRPILHAFFELDGPGVTQVALGHATLEQALFPLALGRPHDAAPGANGNGNGNGNKNGNGHGPDAPVGGILEILPSGPIPPDPGEFVGSEALSETLAALRERADVVLIDAPPLLHVGDAATLSTKVDAVIVATRLNVVRRNMLHELHRQIEALPTPILGFVLTGAGEESGYGYGYGYGYAARPYQPREGTARSRR
jgi:tyrosine-protein kinase